MKNKEPKPKGRDNKIGPLHPYAPNVGCIECKGSNIRINPRKVTCSDCGVSIPRDEYEDYIEQKRKERRNRKEY